MKGVGGGGGSVFYIHVSADDETERVWVFVSKGELRSTMFVFDIFLRPAHR